jgi:carbamoyl-phosphate synthase large subunit
VLLRPSYVLGGRAMEIVYDEKDLKRYIREAVRVQVGRYAAAGRPLSVRRHRSRRRRHVRRQDTHVAGIMEHIEEAGIHSGDSACSMPPYTLSPRSWPSSPNRRASWPRR